MAKAQTVYIPSPEVVFKGKKIHSFLFGGIPWPLSLTVMAKYFCSFKNGRGRFLVERLRCDGRAETSFDPICMTK